MTSVISYVKLAYEIYYSMARTGKINFFER